MMNWGMAKSNAEVGKAEVQFAIQHSLQHSALSIQHFF
jgi:hypothetical protein